MITLEPYSKEKLGIRLFNCTANMRLLEDFADADLDCVKVVGWNHSSAYSCVHALNESAKRYHLYHIKAISRKGEVFLIKLND